MQQHKPITTTRSTHPHHQLRAPSATIQRRRFLGAILGTAAGLALAPQQQVFARAADFTPFWVQNHRTTRLWSGPDNHATNYGSIPQWSYLNVVRPQQAPRLYVYVPWTNDYAYVDAADVGPSGAPPAGWKPRIVAPAAAPRTVPGLLAPAPQHWQGVVRASEFVVRSAPTRQAPIVAELPTGTPIVVDAWVKGDTLSADNYTWGRVGPNLFGYSAALQITPPNQPPPLPSSAPSTGRWIDVNLTRQIVTAYEGRNPVRIIVTASGRPSWDTPTGTFRVLRRVYDETMDGATLLALDLSPSQRNETHYRLTGVLHTQYFTWAGNALHYNYWLPDWAFGVPRSHGCLGLRLADSSFLWNWADFGTPISIHD